MLTNSIEYLYLGRASDLPSQFLVVFRPGIFFDSSNFPEQLVFVQRKTYVHIAVAAGFGVVFFLDILAVGWLFLRKRKARKKIQKYYALYIK